MRAALSRVSPTSASRAVSPPKGSPQGQGVVVSLQHLHGFADVQGGPSLVQVALVRRIKKPAGALGSVVVDAPTCAPQTSYGSVQRT